LRDINERRRDTWSKTKSKIIQKRMEFLNEKIALRKVTMEIMIKDISLISFIISIKNMNQKK
jgi:hypothetical protein